ncbi:MAG: DNA repair and recombination protein RadB [Methanophagales archaeon ANME-1-THS]|nr:MAG: DNA repair and recombination protein RadB [Methanophagales archaeon ANME-1-THS]
MHLPRKYSTGCKSIDELLGGGFESGTVTQLYGEAGSGKTNICLQAVVESTKQGKSAIFIDTEGFSPERFVQIAGARTGEHEDLESIARRIMVYQPQNFEQQMACIKELDTVIKDKGGENGISLIILDSATLFYRLELGDDRDVNLRRTLANQILHLLEVARRHDLAVVITNQVYTDIEEGKLRPSGGSALEHLSKVIVQLDKVAGERGKRRAILRKHRSMPEDMVCEFFITSKGVEDRPR